MLVTSLRAFDRYHARDGAGPSAAAWERQALVRARPVAGDADLAARAALRIEAIAYGGGPPAVEEVAALRARMQRELAREGRDRYHPKLGYGALTDVEFVAQVLQMKHGAWTSGVPGAARHPASPSGAPGAPQNAASEAVRTTSTTQALAALRAAGALDASTADALAASQRFFRRVIDALRLLDETGEPVLARSGRFAARVARALGLRARDRLDPVEVLFLTWRRHAHETRAIFERLLAPVGVPAPWSAP
jgi:glutamate-ammonia-ligase adenylyltransferase